MSFGLIISSKTLKIITAIVIFTCIIIIYIFYNIETTEYTSQFKILNTSDIVQLLQTKSTPQNHTNKPQKSTLFGLELKYKLAPSPCEDQTKILIIVTSHFNNVESRSAMRRAFDTTILEILHIRRVFLLGTVSKETSTSQAAVENESTRFHDLLQGNFIEAYRNLTYKHLMGLKWSGDHCSHAKYVIKMDDDIVIDLRRVVTFLNNGVLEYLRKSTLLAGYVLDNMLPKREPANKWFVTQEEYDKDKYPMFLSGWFYITTPETARLLYLAAGMHQYFWIDDTFITGIVAQMLGVKHFNISQYYTVHPEFLRCCVKDYFKFHLECPYFVGPNGGDANLFIEFNQAVGNCSVEVCKMRSLPIRQTCIDQAKAKLGEGKPASIETYKLI